jgi:hypothetical protein
MSRAKVLRSRAQPPSVQTGCSNWYPLPPHPSAKPPLSPNSPSLSAHPSCLQLLEARGHVKELTAGAEAAAARRAEASSGLDLKRERGAELEAQLAAALEQVGGKRWKRAERRAGREGWAGKWGWGRC